MILPVIPARGGSKGIPRKNLAIVGDKPLIAWSIEMALQVFGVAWVSTEDSEIKTVSLSCGAKVIDRPFEFATDNSQDIDWVRHAFGALAAINLPSRFPDMLAILRPTTPLRLADHVKAALEELQNHPEASGLRSAQLVPESPYKWFEKEGLYWKTNPNADLPRQQLPQVYKPNGYIDLVRYTTIQEGKLFGDKILAFETEAVIEIDSQNELDLINLYSFWDLNPY